MIKLKYSSVEALAMRLLIVAAILICYVTPARAQSAVIFCVPNSTTQPAGSSSCTPVSINNPLPTVSN